MSLPYRPNPTNHYHNYNLNRANLVMTSKERNEGLREARSSLLENYEKSKEEFLKKEEEKARKKLIAKLEKYKGIGEVGNKLGECSLNRKDLNSVRQRQQERYTFESDLHYAENHPNDLEIQKEKERKKLIAKLERYKGIGEIGNRIGEGSSSSENLNVVRKVEQKSCSSKSYSHSTENDLTDLEIQMEKGRKRLDARRERYKGFKVGNKLGEGASNREELNFVREKQQERYSSESNSHSSENYLTDLEIQKEKERKKIIAKLERYKSIGEVGNKLGEGSSNRDDLNAARQKQQEEYSIENNFNDLETKKENERKKCEGIGEPGNKVVEIKELNIAQHECQNISLHQAETQSSSNTCSTSTSKDKNVVSNETDGVSASENDICYKLGGKNDYVRGKGDHPLLARLSGKKK